MIHVDRNRVAPPAVLTSARAARVFEAMRRFYAVPREQRDRRRFPVPIRIWPRDELDALFRGKCAYCETSLGTPAPRSGAGSRPGGETIEHFRPKGGCIDLDGNVFPDHYWWLTLEWSNLYAACRPCNMAKRNRFPIRGERATDEGGPAALAAEGPLLLDPCEPGLAPETILVFGEGGRVAGGDERGKATIDVLNLNRDALVERRKQTAEATRPRLETGLDAYRSASSSERRALERRLLTLIADDAEFAALKRQLLRQILQEWVDVGKIEPAWIEAFATRHATLESVHALWSVTGREDTFEAFASYESAEQSFSVEQDSDREKYYRRRLAVEKVEIRNFRAIEDLTLEFLPDARADVESPWTVLLGENGCGKSSVLQAIALTLMGDRYRRRLGIDAKKVLRRIDERHAGAASPDAGWVKVHLTGLSRPIELHFRKGSSAFEGESDARLLMLAYGATRLLPRGDHHPATGEPFARVDNLFDPFVPLQDAGEWLLGLDRSTFESMGIALKALLNLDSDDRVFIEDGRILVEMAGTILPLEALSDGYQSVLALTTDVMAVMLERWKTMEAAEGLVLLDEIGAHLHPRWRMRVVGSLREAFPGIQFIATTHGPLCLRGLEDGEVVVMRRTPHGIAAITDLPPVKGLPVNQLLTSEHFGLSSTMDPAIEEGFRRYGELLAEGTLTGPQKSELATLRSRLDAYDLMGRTRRERVMLEAIDRHLAREPEEIGRVPAAVWQQRMEAELDRILADLD